MRTHFIYFSKLQNKTKDLLNKTTTGTSSSTDNTTGKATTQGTTGSDDF